MTTSRCVRRNSSRRRIGWLRAMCARSAFPRYITNPVAPMFQPFRLRGLTLENRVVVSPMCQYSSQDGMPNDWHLVHYGSRAIGGAGLMFTEMTDVSALGAHLARLCRHVQRCARSGLETRRRFRACASPARNSACSSATPAARARPS